MSADAGYVRSSRGNVETAQAHIAKTVRDSVGGPDFLDEDAVLLRLEVQQKCVIEAWHVIDA